MTDSTKVAVPNYSKAQEQILRDASPFDLAGAKVLAEQLGKSWQSIVSKAKHLELEYIPKPAPRKKAVQTTKAELVQIVQKRLDRNLEGLEKAPRLVLLLLINGLDHAIPVKVETPLPELGDSAK